MCNCIKLEKKIFCLPESSEFSPTGLNERRRGHAVRSKRLVMNKAFTKSLDSRRCDRSEAQGSEEIFDFTGG